MEESEEGRTQEGWVRLGEEHQGLLQLAEEEAILAEGEEEAVIQVPTAEGEEVPTCLVMLLIQRPSRESTLVTVRSSLW